MAFYTEDNDVFTHTHHFEVKEEKRDRRKNVSQNFNKVETNRKNTVCVCVLFQQNNICENKVEDVMPLTASKLSLQAVTIQSWLYPILSYFYTYLTKVNNIISSP